MSFRTNTVSVNSLISGSVGSVTQGYSAKLTTLAGLTSVGNLSTFAALSLGNSQFLQTDSSGNLEAVSASSTRTNLGLGSAALLAAVATSSGATDSGKTIALNSSGVIDASFLPSIALTTVTTASGTINWATQSSALATGDVLVLTDVNQTWMRNNGTAGTQADFTELLFPATANLSTATGTLTTAHGGTNSDLSNDTTYPINGMMIKSAAGTYTSTAAGTQYQTVVVNSSGVPGFGALALNQAAAVSGVLGVANGGTGAASASAGLIFAGPSSGGMAAPAFRALAATDVPTLNQNTTGSSGSCTGNAATATKLAATKNINGVAFDGSADITIYAAPANTTTANVVYAGPNGAGGAPAFRALVAADIAAVNASAITGQVALANGGTGTDLSTGTHTAAIMYRSGASSSALITDPTVSSSYLQWTGSSFAWATIASPTYTGAANLVLATPNGSSGTASLRALVAADIAAVNASAITGQVAVANGGTGVATAAANLMFASPNGSGGAPSFRSIVAADIAAVNASAITGQVAIANGGTGAASATANYVFAAPNGSTGAPLFRALVAGDISAVNASAISGIVAVVNGGTGASTVAQNLIFGSPNGSTGAPTFRSLVAGDISAVNASAITGQVSFAHGGTGTDLSAGTQVAGIIFRSSTTGVSMVSDPSTSGQYLEWNGSSFAWNTPSATSMPSGAQNLVVATPNGSSGISSLRALVAADIAAVNASAITGQVAIANGGTNLSSMGTAYQILGVNSGATSLEYKTIAAGTGIAVTLAAGLVTISSTGVTNVGLALPNIFTVSGSPVTTTGTLTAVLATTTANVVFAGPNGSGGTPLFRALVAADISAVNASAINGLISVAQGGTGAATATANYVFAGPNGSTGAPLFRALVANDIPAVNATAITGVLTVSQGGTGAATATANYIFAGPNGSAGAPTFRAIVAADIPAVNASAITGQVGLSHGGTGTDLSTGTQVAGLIYRSSTTGASMVADPTTSGTYLEWNGSSFAWATPSASATFTGAANLILATPNGSSGTAALRALVAADIPTHSASLISGVMTTSQGGTGVGSASAHMIFAGPSSGGAGTPTFRALVASEIPTLTVGSGALVNVRYDTAQNVAVTTGNTSIDNTYDVVLATGTSSGTVTITLISVSSALAGKFYIIKDADGMAATNNLVIQAQTGEYIDGSNTHTINQNYESVQLVLGNGKWNIC